MLITSKDNNRIKEIRKLLNKKYSISKGLFVIEGENLIEEAIKDHIAPFDQQLDVWYADQQRNGREINLTVRCWDNWENDLETEYDGEELTDCIQDWLDDNTVNSMYNLSDGSDSFLQFEQVRIPLYDERGRAMDARDFATELRKYLRKSPFEITAKVMVRGLGEAIIVLGEK